MSSLTTNVLLSALLHYQLYLITLLAYGRRGRSGGCVHQQDDVEGPSEVNYFRET